MAKYKEIIYRFQHGFTLIELLLSISLSSFFIIIIINFYTQFKQQHYQLMLHLQLQQETHRILQLIGKDLKRAGFRAVNERVLAKEEGNNFSLFEQSQGKKAIAIYGRNINQPANCVLFFYDLNADGCLGKHRAGNCGTTQRNNTTEIRNELFGYRENNHQLQTWLTYSNAVQDKCDKAKCQQYLQQDMCEQNRGWAGLLDEQVYLLDELSFYWLGSKGIEIKLGLRLRDTPSITYQANMVVPLLNE